VIPRFSTLAACCALGAFAGCRVGYDVAPKPSPSAGAAGAAGGPLAEGGASSGGEAGIDAIGGGAGGETSGSGGTSENQGGSAQSQGGATNEGGMAGASADGGGGTSNGGATNGGMTGGAGTTGTGGGAGATNGGAGATNGGAGGGAGATAGGAGSGGSGGIVAGCSASGSYVICPTGATHDVAVANCTSMGMQIIRVDSAAENDWLVATVPNSWIGASDVTVEGEWRWQDGTLFWLGDDTGAPQAGLYDNWAFKSPAGSPSGADCAKLNGTGAWVAVLCPTTAPYTCEPP